MVRTLLGCVLLLVLPFALAEEEGRLTPGSNIPGSFHPYNVNQRIDPDPEPIAKEAGKPKERATKGKYHCLVTAYDMDPVVMLVARNLDDNQAFRELLKKLDAAITRHRIERLRCFVVALYDDLNDVIKQDEKRDSYAARLDKMVSDLNLKGVVVTLAAPSDLVKYTLDDSAALNALLYRKLKLEAVKDFSRETLDEADSPEILALLKAVDALVPSRR
jgi:hypothetical protein